MITYEDSKSITDYLRKRLGDKIDISDWGATVKPKGKDLSKGCYACKSGSWICIYIGVSCNLNCVSCPQKTRHDENERIWANGGNDDIQSLEDLRRVLDRNPRITGISFSGGEPFMYLEKVHEWLDFINENYSDLNLYKWIYTNGTLVTKEKCIELKEKGINEIRFDISASKYNKKVLNKLKYCKNIFDKLSVEIPVEPWQMDNLLKNLHILDETGVDYLNLHELSINEDNYNDLVNGGYIDPSLIYHSYSGDHYLPSVIDTYKVIEYIENNNLNLIYNDCSARNMVLQMMGWQYQRNRQNPDYAWEEWDDFTKRAEKDGNTP